MIAILSSAIITSFGVALRIALIPIFTIVVLIAIALCVVGIILLLGLCIKIMTILKEFIDK